MDETTGRYRIKKQIGQGAMGIVYLAYDDMIDRLVAIKSLRLDKSDEEERKRVRELFFREAKIIGRLSHSHITAIYDMGEQDDRPYIVMEYVNGKTIRELIESGDAFSLQDKLKLLSMAARAFHYAHQRGIIHRDIKPANIMILPNNTPKIMDFGIAGIRESAARPAANDADREESVILGTPAYMSPEQVRGRRLDARSDLFSLGVLAYEWIGGKRPFPGGNLKEILTAVVSEPQKPLKEFCGTDENLSRLVDRALEKKADNRYQNADEFADAVEMYLETTDKKKNAESEAERFSYDKLKIAKQIRKNYIFFSAMTDEELFAIFKLSGKEKFEKGEVIIQEGSSGSKMYIMVSGSVAIIKETDGKRIELNRLGEGDCFGEMSILDKMPRSASAIAREPTVAIAINEIVLRHSNPQLCLKLYRSLASMISEKLRLSDNRYSDLVSRIKKKQPDAG
ncbi:MAG: hypothetical protein IEMM0002_0917 [bacterium]|nr:MAG: hypothetical protein IEMM0002_0917 [bacterium]